MTTMSMISVRQWRHFLHAIPKKWTNKPAWSSGSAELCEWQLFQLYDALDSRWACALLTKIPLPLSLLQKRGCCRRPALEQVQPDRSIPSPSQSSTIPGCSAPVEGSWSCWWCLWVSSSCSPGFTCSWGTRKVSIEALIVRSLDLWKETISVRQTLAYFSVFWCRLDRQRVFLLSWGDLGVKTVSQSLISVCALKSSSDGSVILRDAQ